MRAHVARLGLAMLLGLAGVALLPLHARGEAAPDPAPGAAATRALEVQRAELKRLEVALLVAPARREWRERREQLRRLARTGRWTPPAAAARDPGERAYVVPQSARPAPTLGLLPPPNPRALAPNRLVYGQDAWAQSEVSIAASGAHLVAAWNDASLTLHNGTMAFATSMDGGATWSRGELPLGRRVGAWESDPTLTVDERTGRFTLAALALATGPAANAIASVTGSFSDSGFAWDPAVLVRAPHDTLPDKPWIAADSSSGAIYLTYTTFVFAGKRFTSHIDLQRSPDGGRSWSAPQRLSTPPEEGLVQGSRPAVLPGGGVEVVWVTVDTLADARGRDLIRMTTSTDGGATFGPRHDVARMVTNFASGAPGYNRPWGPNFPSIAVDWSGGPHRGRTYLCWTESLDYFETPLGGSVAVDASGDSAQTPRLLHGSDVVDGVAPAQGSVGFLIDARAGQTLATRLDPDGGADLILLVTCADGTTRYALSDPPLVDVPRLAIVTFPVTGRYAVQVTNAGDTSARFRLTTGWARHGPERGRDQRDVFVSHTDDGVHWSDPARANDGPPRFDDWLPEVAVAGGRPFVAWYSWQDSPATACGAVSDVLLARSDDGGDSWRTLGPLTDHPSDWSAATSNIVPNQGDYIGLASDSAAVLAIWADARFGTPDVEFARVDGGGPAAPAEIGPAIAIERVGPNPTRGAVSLTARVRAGAPIRLELWDVAGRLRVARALPGAPAGAIAASFDPGPAVAAGVYFLRIVQPGASASARIAIVR